MNPAESEIYEFGPFRFDGTDRTLFKDGQILPLPPKALDTLAVLVKNQGRVVEKSTLIAAVWPDTFVEENNLNRSPSRLPVCRACAAGSHTRTKCTGAGHASSCTACC